MERTGIISLDPETNEPGWILTKMGLDNKPIVNKYGHFNQYIVAGSKFKSMYEPSVDAPGLYSKRQVDILLNGGNILFNKVPSEFVVVKGNNTFDYIPKELQKLPLEQFRQYISEDCYKKQYIFMTKYLKTALEFCRNIEKENYILVCNLDEELIESYIGVGDYKAGDYRIEYRVPS